MILKQDVLGRVRATAERRAAVVAEFRGSGLSGYRFARLAGMKYPTLMAWVKRAGGSTPVVRKASVKQRPMLVEAILGGSPQAMRTVSPLLVHLGGGVRLELTDASQLGSGGWWPNAGQVTKDLRSSASSHLGPTGVLAATAAAPSQFYLAGKASVVGVITENGINRTLRVGNASKWPEFARFAF